MCAVHRGVRAEVGLAHSLHEEQALVQRRGGMLGAALLSAGVGAGVGPGVGTGGRECEAARPGVAGEVDDGEGRLSELREHGGGARLGLGVGLG